MKNLLKLSTLSSAILLSACGGGGGASTTPVTSSTTETQDPNNKIMLILQPNTSQMSAIKSASEKLRAEKVKQMQSELIQPLPEAKIREISAAARQKVIDYGPLALGGRVLAFDHNLSDAEMNQALQNIKTQVSEVKDVIKDHTIEQASANTTEINPIQWYLYDKVEPVQGSTAPYYGSSFIDNSTKTFVDHRGAGVTIAVLDTGYVPHPNFIEALIPNDDQGHYGYSFLSDCYGAGICSAETPLEQRHMDPKADALETGINTSKNWHGTSVISLISGQGHNVYNSAINMTVTGGAPEARIVPVRVLGIRSSTDSDVINGMLWSAGLHPTIPNPNPAQILQMSIWGRYACSTTAYQETIDEILAHNISIVVSAGNNANYSVNEISPAGCDGVISVAALGHQQRVSAYSVGGKVTIAAPGGDSRTYAFDPYINLISDTYSGTEYGNCPSGNCFSTAGFSGTSAAAPLVSAAIADMLSANPSLSPVEITQILRDSANPFPTSSSPTLNYSCPGGRVDMGWKCVQDAGALNVKKAMDLATSSKYE